MYADLCSTWWNMTRGLIHPLSGLHPTPWCIVEGERIELLKALSLKGPGRSGVGGTRERERERKRKRENLLHTG